MTGSPPPSLSCRLLNARPSCAAAISSMLRPDCDAGGLRSRPIGLPLAAHMIVALLDQQPVVLVALVAARAAAPAPICPAAARRAGSKASLPFFSASSTSPLLRLPGAAVPQHHGAAAIFAFRNRAFELAVFDRVILDMHREPLVVRILARALRHRPAHQHAVPFQAEVVVQPARVVLLDQIAQLACPDLRGVALRLRGAREIALGVVFTQAVRQRAAIRRPSSAARVLRARLPALRLATCATRLCVALPRRASLRPCRRRGLVVTGRRHLSRCA